MREQTSSATAGARTLLRSLLSTPTSGLAVAYLTALIVVAATAPWISPHDPLAQNLGNAFAGLSLDHPLGTDEFGRDVLSRLAHACQIAVVGPLIAVAVAVGLGVPAGLWSGYSRGWFARFLARGAEVLLSLPPIIAAIAVIAVLGPGLLKAMVAIGIVFAPRLFRVVRGATLAVANETYIASAHSIGASRSRILWGHCLPNVMAPLLVQVTLMLGFALLAESSLSFLGLGVQLPEASWGSMLRSASQHQFQAPYAVVAPGVALTLTILAFNTVGDGIRDALASRGGER
ncbi:ABC transporter permease [Aeromicrobium phragmitis]|uniref:ABC transporter permease n=1 Tax=Aeromicrobium phragmitis TaxID=2478914 RepID=A0A3L8PQU5_9ACTN|nr:ABC transporter permease [Aeromicrobium phragmitis]RLV57249.1 ABC transporter permease [Aeromicrobium phragmitis]